MSLMNALIYCFESLKSLRKKNVSSLITDTVDTGFIASIGIGTYYYEND